MPVCLLVGSYAKRIIGEYFLNVFKINIEIDIKYFLHFAKDFGSYRWVIIQSKNIK